MENSHSTSRHKRRWRCSGICPQARDVSGFELHYGCYKCAKSNCMSDFFLGIPVVKQFQFDYCVEVKDNTSYPPINYATVGRTHNSSSSFVIWVTNIYCCGHVTAQVEIHYTFCCDVLQELEDDKRLTAKIVISDEASSFHGGHIIDITLEFRGPAVRLQWIVGGTRGRPNNM